MKICCMIASLRLGGAERQLSGLALLLHTYGHDVEVLTYREGSFYAKELQEAGVKHTVISHPGSDLKLIDTIAAHLKEVKCEVLVSYLLGSNIKACLIKRKYPALKIIVSERNCTRHFGLYTSLRLSFYKIADYVVCNSYAQEEVVRKHCPSLSGKLTTIPNFVDSCRFKPSERNGSSDDKCIKILTTARLHSRKNATGLIKAAADAGCENLHFDWYGALSKDKYYRRCRKLICKLGLQNRFHIHPGCDKVEQLYGEADVFCLPSFYEGTSNSLAEALSSGLPVVCSDVSDAARYIIPGQNGLLFNPKDRKRFAETLRALAATPPEVLRQWGRKSRETAVSKLSREMFIKRYLDLLEGVLGGKI